MDPATRTALVTGADRGFGRAPAAERIARGRVLDVLSTPSRPGFPGAGASSAAKAAAWPLTDGPQASPAPRGVRVPALHVGCMDTDVAAGAEAPESDPADIARPTVVGLVAGSPEIVADGVSRRVQVGVSGGVAALCPALS